MYFTNKLDCEVQTERTSCNSQEVQFALDNFKSRVKTAEGVKDFFETCSEINALINENTAMTFNIVNHGEHFIYSLDASDRHRIGLYDGSRIIVDKFLDDDYFNKFLLMLSGAVTVSCTKQGRMV